MSKWKHLIKKPKKKPTTKYHYPKSYKFTSQKEVEQFILKGTTSSMHPTDKIIQKEQLMHFEKFEELMKLNEKKGIPVKQINPEEYVRRHQTLIAVNVKNKPNDLQVERATRFVSSLNNVASIKVDVVSVADGKVYEGLVWTGTKPGGANMEDFAKKHGYVQVCTLDYVYEKEM